MLLKPRTAFVAAVSIAPTLAPAVGLLSAMALLALPQRTHKFVFAASALVAAVSAPAFKQRTHERPKSVDRATFMVLSSNLWCCNKDHDAASKVLAAANADVTVLCEELPAVRSLIPEGTNQMVFTRFDGTHRYEIVVLTKHMLTHVVDITAGTRSFPMVQGSIPAGSIIVVAVHTLAPPHGLKEWQAQLSGLASRLSRAPQGGLPLVVAGDFNASITHRGLRNVLRKARLFDAAQWYRRAWMPTWGPFGKMFVLALDHILFSDALSCESFELGVLPGSDHRFVVARFAYSQAR